MEKEVANLIQKRGKLSHLISLGRPWNSILLFLATLLGALLAGGTIEISALLIGVIFVLLYMAGTTLNDIFDFEEDKINMPYRPLQREIITINEAYLFSIALYLIGLVLAYIVSPPALLLASTFVVLSLAYSAEPLNLVRRGILGNITLGVVSLTIPFIAGFISTGTTIGLLSTLFIVSLTITFIGISFFKDFKDIKGDKGKKKTLVVKFGKDKVIFLGNLTTILFYPLSIILLLIIKNNLVYISAILFLVPLLLVKNKKLTQKDEEKRFIKLRLILLAMLLYLSILLILF